MLYWRPPSAEALAGGAFSAEDFEPDPVECWPDCEPALRLFQRLRTQWRTGMNGPTGLDYGPLFALMERMRLGDDEHDALFEDIQTLEAGALEAMHTKD